MPRLAVGLRLIKENGSCEVIICVECVKGKTARPPVAWFGTFYFAFRDFRCDVCAV